MNDVLRFSPIRVSPVVARAMTMRCARPHFDVVASWCSGYLTATRPPHLGIYQGDWTMLHLTSSVTFGVDVADFLELECALMA
jgi:hypothetical protein